MLLTLFDRAGCRMLADFPYQQVMAIDGSEVLLSILQAFQVVGSIPPLLP